MTASSKKSGNAKQRHIPLQQLFNLRDLGGYPAADGKHTVWGKVFRSDELGMATDTDLDALAAMSIKTVVDFRSPKEAARLPNRKPASLEQEIFLAIDPGNVTSLPQVTAEQGITMMEEINRMLVRDCHDTYSQFFDLLLRQKNTPLLFHCAAGKDRTGFAAALFLGGTGVTRDVIMQDYLLSAECLQGKYGEAVASKPHLLPLYTVYPSYLTTALDLIDTEYGGMEKYLTGTLHVDIAKLRAMYTA